MSATATSLAAAILVAAILPAQDAAPVRDAPGVTPAWSAQADDLGAILLARLAGQSPKALRGVQLAWTSYAESEDKEPGPKTGEFTASLLYPDKLRIEAHFASGTVTVWKRKGKSSIVGTGDSGFHELGPEAQKKLEDSFRLLATLVGWDLLDGPAKTERNRLTSATSWHPQTPKVSVTRRFDDDQQLREITIGKQRYVPSGKLESSGGAIPKTVKLPSGDVLSFTRFMRSCAFKDSFFERGSGGGRKIRSGPSRHTTPRLDELAARYEVVLDDPGTWPKRFERAGQLGVKLMNLGWFPHLLNMTGQGHAVLPFAADPRSKRAPKPITSIELDDGKRFAVKHVPERLVLSVYGKLVWKQARQNLHAKLLRYAREIGHRPTGPLYLEPLVQPTEAAPDGPGADEAILIKALIEVR